MPRDYVPLGDAEFTLVQEGVKEQEALQTLPQSLSHVQRCRLYQWAGGSFPEVGGGLWP